MMNRSRGRKLPYVVLDGFTQTRLVNSVGTFVFARKQPESTTNFDVYARTFASQTGIVEDPATGA